jgi:GNAT superfamily N-acetyltransferase
MGGMTGLFEPPVPITADHDVPGFSCGNQALDEWLAATALKAEGRSARTYVVCRGRKVAAYYCLATGAVGRGNAPGRVRRNAPDPVPVLVIGRLAVDRACQGQGIGAGMLRDALRRAVLAAEIVGCRAVLVHAIDADAVAFYARYGFAEFPDGARTMFLPTDTIAEAL